MLRKIRLLILDFDYLIFDCSAVKAMSLRESLLSLADEIPQDVRLPDAGDAEEGYQEYGRHWIEALQIGLSEEHLSNLQSACRTNEQRLAADGAGSIFPGLTEFLEFCREEGATLAIGAESQRDYLLAVSDFHGLHELFEVEFCTEDFGKGGTEEMFDEIMERVGVSRSETLALGTRQDFFRAAQSLGIVTIGCGWGVSDQAILQGADLQAPSVMQAYSALEEADDMALRSLG